MSGGCARVSLPYIYIIIAVEKYRDCRSRHKSQKEIGISDLLFCRCVGLNPSFGWCNEIGRADRCMDFD